jgi:iron-sulfur cluster assembly accessory protein
MSNPCDVPANPPAPPPDEPAVTITPNAAEMVLKARQESNIPPEQALRLGVRGGGCSGFTYDLSFDAPRPEGDRIFTQHGVTLVVDEMSLQYLAGTELDYVEGLMGAGFKFNNPNVKGTCGCGSSFTT